jgi:anti-anti-sigma regulatory factor
MNEITHDLQECSGPAPEATAFTLLMPPMMTIDTAEALAGVFRSMPVVGVSVVSLDVSEVEAITVPGLQVIVALGKAIKAQGGKLAFIGVRESFASACADTGLGELLT